jgi:hypothetical protein
LRKAVDIQLSQSCFLIEKVFNFQSISSLNSKFGFKPAKRPGKYVPDPKCIDARIFRHAQIIQDWPDISVPLALF